MHLYALSPTAHTNASHSCSILISAAKKLPKDVNATAVFACNELNLNEIQVYGFDYDYTLACYKPALNDLLYDLGRDTLIDKFKVPETVLCILHINESKRNLTTRSLYLHNIRDRLDYTVSKGNKRTELYARICHPWTTLRHREGFVAEIGFIPTNSVGLRVPWPHQSAGQ